MKPEERSKVRELVGDRADPRENERARYLKGPEDSRRLLQRFVDS